MNLKNKFRILRKQDGFTLVELIVVIAIVAILGGVAVPAYTGYIEKTNITADKQLLADVNKAFISACMMAGESNIGQEVSDQTIENGKLVYTGPHGDYFNNFYEDGEFKVATKLEYDEANGVFTAPELDGGGNGGVFSNLLSTIKDKYAQAIEATKNTSLGKIGTDVLFDQMNSAMDMASELNLHNLTGAPFAEAYFEYLGIDLDAYDLETEEGAAAAQAALDAKLAALGVDDTTASTHAIALYAAQNSTNLSTSDLTKWLGSDKTTDDLMANPNANTLAETAAIYSMYLSYSKEQNGTVPSGTTLDVMTQALTDSNFATWVSDSNSSAQSELSAYKTYMSFINEAAQDEDAKNAILSNGFNNPEMEDLVKDLMGG